MRKFEVAVLFGIGTDPRLAKAYALFERGIGAVDGELLSLIASVQDTDVVAKITTARAISAPTTAHFWLRYLKRNVFGGEPMYSRATGHFVQGVVLGLFEATVWFDNHCFAQKGFFDELPGVCVQMIVGDNKLQQSANALQFDPTCSGRLANAIKAYAKGTDVNRECRFAEIGRIINEVIGHISGPGVVGKKELGKLGNFVLGQFTFARFNKMDVVDQAGALSAHMTAFRERLLGRVDKQGE